MLASAFILGLLGSLHCVGMCGPIALMLPVDRTNHFKKMLQIFLYHAGRILSYTSIGLLFGFIGKGFYIFGIQQQLSIFIGLLMILVVLIPLEIFNKYNFSKPLFNLISKVKSTLGKQFKKKSNKAIFSIGFLNGFLPCGLVYMALFGSIATGSSVKGALYMFLFGLGTIPLMSIAAYIGNFLSSTAKNKIQHIIPVAIIIIGVLFVIRGLGLGIPYLSPLPVTQIVSSNIECH